MLDANGISLDEAKLWGAIADVTDAMPTVVMRRIVDQVLSLIQAADGAVVELVDGDALAYVCAAGTLAEHVGLRLARDGSLSGLSVRRNETLYCRDATTDERVDRQACARVGTISMVCVPLRRGEMPVGVLKVSAAHAHAFDDDDVSVLTKLAKFITVAISAASDIATITHELQASFDPLVLRREAPDPMTPRGMDGVSGFVANVLGPGIAGEIATRQRIEEILAGRDIQMLCQPIVDLHSGQLIAAEALARFPGPPQQPPDVWFTQAHQVGLGVPLQMLAVELAVGLANDIPAPAWLCVNAGPDAMLAPELPNILAAAEAHRIVLELTEHTAIEDYQHLRDALCGLRQQCAAFAVDDTGAGIASMAHIVKLAPDLLKLDRVFTSGIDIDPVRRSVAGAFVTLAKETGARIIAEGIETAAELHTVRELGIPYGQGYYIARPQPVTALRQNYTHAASDAADADRPSQPQARAHTNRQPAVA